MGIRRRQLEKVEDKPIIYNDVRGVGAISLMPLFLSEEARPALIKIVLEGARALGLNYWELQKQNLGMEANTNVQLSVAEQEVVWQVMNLGNIKHTFWRFRDYNPKTNPDLAADENEKQQPEPVAGLFEEVEPVFHIITLREVVALDPPVAYFIENPDLPTGAELDDMCIVVDIPHHRFDETVEMTTVELYFDDNNFVPDSGASGTGSVGKYPVAAVSRSDGVKGQIGEPRAGTMIVLGGLDIPLPPIPGFGGRYKAAIAGSRIGQANYPFVDYYPLYMRGWLGEIEGDGSLSNQPPFSPARLLGELSNEQSWGNVFEELANGLQANINHARLHAVPPSIPTTDNRPVPIPTDPVPPIIVTGGDGGNGGEPQTPVIQLIDDVADAARILLPVLVDIGSQLIGLL